MIFKVVLVVVHNLFNQSRVVGNMSVLFIVAAYTSMMILSHPILKKLVNRTELAAHYILFTIIVLKEIIIFSEFRWIQVTASILNVILNYGFILVVIWYIILFKVEGL